MFLVGGGILSHAIPGFHEWVHHQAGSLRERAALGAVLAATLPTMIDFVIGVLGGSIVLAVWSLAQRLRAKPGPDWREETRPSSGGCPARGLL
jgi:predicted DNA repair protein MutK